MAAEHDHSTWMAVGKQVAMVALALLVGFFWKGVTDNSGQEVNQKFAVEQAKMATELSAISKQLDVLNSNRYTALDAQRDASYIGNRFNALSERMNTMQADIAALRAELNEQAKGRR